VRAVAIAAAILVIVVEFIAFLVWLHYEPPPYHEEDQ